MPKLMLQCSHCKKEFAPKNHVNTAILCGRECYFESLRHPEKKCLACGKPFKSPAKTCSHTCRSVYRFRENGVHDGKKKRSTCKETRPISCFHPMKAGLDGLEAKCIPCRKTANNTRYHANKAHTRISAKALRDARPVEVTMLKSAKNRAVKKNMDFSITLSDVTCPEVCPVFGTPLKKNTGIRGAASDSPSLDRVDNRYGYVPGNVAVVSWKANRMKGEASLEELEALVNWMKTHSAIQARSRSAA